MFADAYLAILRFIEMGGDVLWLIAIITFLMWTLIFERFWYFQTEHKTHRLDDKTGRYNVVAVKVSRPHATFLLNSVNS